MDFYPHFSIFRVFWTLYPSKRHVLAEVLIKERLFTMTVYHEYQFNAMALIVTFKVKPFVHNIKK